MMLDDVRSNLLNAVCKLSLLQSIDPDVLSSSDPDVLSKAHNILFAVRALSDELSKEIYSCILDIEQYELAPQV